MKALIVVTHLLGTGHLARALTLGRAMRDAGHEVTVVSGGLPVPHFDTRGMCFVQLPPLQSNGVDFSVLLDADGVQATDRLHAERQAQLIKAFDTARPDTLVVELFPFGRRSLRHEFSALLEHAVCAAHRPVIACSIRDILAPPSKPRKAAFAADMVARFFDAILCHADPEIVTLGQSWPLSEPVSEPIQSRLHYTGFVAPTPPAPAPCRDGPVLVSAGGGTVGTAVFEAAIATARTLPETDWHLLVGGAEARREALAKQAPSNVTLTPPSPAFRDMLARARASVSMCGYNTALDVLQTGAPAVLVPFDDGQEVEQTLRANALGTLPGIAVIKQSELDAELLHDALMSVMAQSRAPRRDGMDGAATTVRLLEELVDANT